MASIKDIKHRISSVSSTAQITKAMQMVSASKMKKAQARALDALPYSEGIFDLVKKIGKVSDYSSIYLRNVKSVKNIAIVVIGTSRGFVSGQISALMSETARLVIDLKHKYPQAQFKGVSIHKTAQKVLASTGIKNDFHFAQYIETPTTTDLTPIFTFLIEKFSSEEYDQIYLIYTHFINTMLQTPLSKLILPLSLEKIIKEAEKIVSKEDLSVNDQFIYEPNTKEVLDRLLPEYFQTQVFTGLLESIASEHSARMVAMKNATDNAEELQKQLVKSFNKSRQASITQEIIEVISGASE